MKPMQILVSGAAGFIGYHLAQKLLHLGFTVIGIDNLNLAYNPAFKRDRLQRLYKSPNFIFYETDILKPKLLMRIFESHQISIVYHLAARTGVRASIKFPKLYQQTNVLGTKNLYLLAAHLNVRQFIFASSSSVYGDSQTPFKETIPLPTPTSPYASSKQSAEKMIQTLYKRSPISTTILRFFSVYGPHGRPDMAPYIFTEAILNSTPLTLYGNGKQARDYTYIDDIVFGLISAMKNRFPFEIVNLGNDSPITIYDLISIIEKISGKRAKISQKPLRNEEVNITWADIGKAKKILHWQPKTSLKAGIEKFVTWYKKERI